METHLQYWRNNWWSVEILGGSTKIIDCRARCLWAQCSPGQNTSRPLKKMPTRRYGMCCRCAIVTKTHRYGLSYRVGRQTSAGSDKPTSMCDAGAGSSLLRLASRMARGTESGETPYRLFSKRSADLILSLYGTTYIRNE